MRVSHLAAVATLIALLGAMFIAMGSASAAPALTVSINDSDNVVAAGMGYQIQLSVKDGGTDTDGYTVEYITASSGVFVSLATDVAVNDDPAEATLVVPKSAAGTYTITAGVVDDAGTPVRLSDDLDVKVGDVGDPIGSVEVALGTVYDADSNGLPNFVIAATSDANKGISGTDSGTKPSSSVIGVTVSVKNSLGNAPNGGEISEILVFAPSAFVVEASGEEEAVINTVQDPENANSSEGTTSATATSFNFWVSDTDEGTIDVYAVAIGSKGGTATSPSLTLAFTGGADSIEASAANSPIAQKEGSGYVTITATDKSGNAANLNAAAGSDNVTAKLVDADGTQIQSSKATWVVEQAPKAGVLFKPTENDPDTTVDETADANNCDGTNGDAECDAKSLRVTITTTAAGLAPGEYTLQVKLGAKDPVTSTVIVAGGATNVAIEGSSETVVLGDIVTFTATVTDDDGNVVPDGTSVEFNAVGALVLTGLGGDANAGVVTAPLNDGVASARYVVVRGSGTATIIATHGDGAMAIDGVTSVSTMAEEAEAMPEEEASVSCLSELSGFATWSCGVSADASEIFEMVSARGVSAIHLWNGSTWVRYSVVDDAMVPGSSDFMVTENDILYISN